MASREAVERRRAHRRILSQIKQRKAQEGIRRNPPADLRRSRERKVASRMLRRFFPNGSPFLICADYCFWQLWSCGWNVLSPEIARNVEDRPCAPEECETWLWWGELHYKQRDSIARYNRVRNVRRAVVVGITHIDKNSPAFIGDCAA